MLPLCLIFEGKVFVKNYTALKFDLVVQHRTRNLPRAAALSRPKLDFLEEYLRIRIKAFKVETIKNSFGVASIRDSRIYPTAPGLDCDKAQGKS